ncbi:AhpA/YtjB family protein [Thalassotalea atypica]|uniref:AhpA/YtjB family protein n=1 Tax=Thalassotalea atypica TaxID=2054316 RepID=UPI0025740BBA|nr:AhpA/YtjB family protein [Thalassotalea atypica]
MSQTAMPLYPKISSIYNKIMQLAIAIIFIVTLMNIWIDNVAKDHQEVKDHFNFISDQYIQQVKVGVQVLLEQGDNKGVQRFLDKLAQEPFVDSVYLYDESGQLNAKAGNQASIKALYGIALNTRNRSQNFVPFMSEIRAQAVQGYVRIDMNKEAVISALVTENSDRQQLIRIMLIMAGLAGFFLTRGLSRFSRQGFRIAAGK